MTEQNSLSSKRWIFGVILGIGVAVSLGASLDNIAVGIGVGVGVGVAMAAGLYRRDHGPSE